MKVNFLNFSDPKDHHYFLLTGEEFILKQDAVKHILDKLGNKGFNEKVIISQDELDKTQEIISRNMGGSLFQENLILHKIGRAHVRTPVTSQSRMPSSA